jgi:cathepsin C
LSFLLFAGIAGVTRGDTPANCTFEDISGTWNFYEGSRGYFSDIDCDSFDLSTFSHVKQVQLLFPNLAIDGYGNEGTWTLIYNQGFEVNINGRRYFAFSNYSTEGTTVTNRCFETQLGWAHDIYIRDWSCYYGVKQGTKIVKKHKDWSLSKDVKKQLTHEPFQVNQEFIDSINEKQSSWKAAAYEQFDGMPKKHLLRMLGGHKSRISSRPKPQEPPARVLAKLQDKVPTSYDWRNVNGLNFVSPVRNQGECGSCYSFASMAMLEARVRILSNNTEQPVFSPNDILECSKYAQGCDGGFPYLIAGKYAEEIGVVPETCNPYNPPSSKHPTCHTDAKCRRFYATDYSYIGGFYGACNEALMKYALVKNGPIVVGLEVYDDFMHYKSGVYHHTGLVDKVNGMNKWNPFQITNHAVLVVGYGTDDKTREPYWIVKNSWGPSWGENGFFRIRRGTDECGIESLAVESTPIPTY